MVVLSRMATGVKLEIERNRLNYYNKCFADVGYNAIKNFKKVYAKNDCTMENTKKY